MDKTTLVNLDLDLGSHILEALDAARLPVEVAALVVFPEYDDWRLVLSSSGLDQTRPLEAHKQLARLINDLGGDLRPPILILPLKDPFIRGLRKAFGKTQSVSGMRLGGQTIGDRFITDAYVYRIA